MALWCSHCHAGSEVRITGQFVSCSRCGRIIEELPMALELSQSKKRKESATTWCSHCMAFCKTRKFSNFLDCQECGKVLGDLYSVPKSRGPIRKIRRNRCKIIKIDV